MNVILFLSLSMLLSCFVRCFLGFSQFLNTVIIIICCTSSDCISGSMKKHKNTTGIGKMSHTFILNSSQQTLMKIPGFIYQKYISIISRYTQRIMTKTTTPATNIGVAFNREPRPLACIPFLFILVQTENKRTAKGLWFVSN